MVNVGQAKEYAQATTTDKLKRFYYQTLRRRDFDFMEKAVMPKQELLVHGTLSRQADAYVLRDPQLVIGSDRNAFYDFMGRQKEQHYLRIRNLMKFGMAVTFAHFIVVQVPSLFSVYFGDSVNPLVQKLGAEDYSERAHQIQVMKEASRRKEL